MLRTLIFICISHVCLGQQNFIGDKLKPAGQSKIKIKTINKPNLVVEEPEFTIRFDKESVLVELYKQSKNLESDWRTLFQEAINYIKSEEEIVLHNIWSEWLNSDTVSIFNERLSQLAISQRLLREPLCSQIEVGKFQLVVKGNPILYFYSDRVDSNYGENVQGYFTEDGFFFWICPPFYID